MIQSGRVRRHEGKSPYQDLEIDGRLCVMVGKGKLQRLPHNLCLCFLSLFSKHVNKTKKGGKQVLIFITQGNGRYWT